MARALIFIFLYGALSIIGLGLSVFWSKVLFRRAREIRGKWRWFHDRYFILAGVIAITSVGTVLIDTGRIFGNLFYGLSPILQHKESWPIGVGMALVFLGYIGAVWLADLERDPPTFRWLKVLATTTLIWLVVAYFISPDVPFYPPNVPAHKL